MSQRHIGATGSRDAAAGARSRGVSATICSLEMRAPGGQPPGESAMSLSRAARLGPTTPVTGGHSPQRGPESCHVALEFLGELALVARWTMRRDMWHPPCLSWAVAAIPSAQDSSPFESVSRPRQEACQGEEGQAGLPEPSWNPKRPVTTGVMEESQKHLSGFSRKHQKVQPGTAGLTEKGHWCQEESVSGSRAGI